MRKLITACLLAITGTFSSLAYTLEEKAEIVGNLYENLKTETTARDSIRTLYDIFDLSPKRGQMDVAWQLYKTAGNAADINVQMDMLRNLSVLYMKNDSVINVLLDLCDKIPNEDARNATKLFVGNQNLSSKTTYGDPSEVQKLLYDRVTGRKNLESSNVYDQIEFLFDASQYLSGDTEGALFRDVFDKYEEIIESLPASDHPLKSQFYTTSAIIHTRNGDARKAVEADRQILKIIGQLQQYYAKKKRRYRNYDRNKFVCYRRMLSNYSALSEEEVRAIRDSINALYYSDEDVRRDMDKHSTTHAAYYMAIKNYDEAIPAIKNSLKNDNLSDYQRTALYRMLREAARKTGDRASLLQALEYYDEYLESKDSLRQVAFLREEMIRERIDSTANIFGPKIERIEAGDLQSAGRPNVALEIVAGILALLLIVYMVLYTRLKTRRNS